MPKLTPEERRSVPPPPEPLPHRVVDTHTHLDMLRDQTGLEPAEVLRAAAAVGVARVAQIGCDLEGSRRAVALAAEHPGVVAGVALHPNDAPLHGAGLVEALDAIEHLAATGHERVRIVGETGIDHFRTTDPEAQRVQRESFARHIAIAKAHDLTLMIHDRDAHAVVADVLDAEGWPERVVMHCFSGDATWARRFLDGGAWLSFPGPVTFRANDWLREALRVTPLDRVLTETDAPYLTPHPHRGRPNASWMIPVTVRSMAETLALDLGDLCRHLDANAEAALGGAW